MPHAWWGLLGALAAGSFWYVYTIPGAIGAMFAICAAFWMWYQRPGPTGAWVALVVLGVGMSGVLAWQAASGSRCPPEGRTVYLKFDKPPVSCTDLRASAASMAVVFGVVGLIGALTPWYARRLPAAETPD